MFKPLIASFLPEHYRRRDWVFLWAGHLFVALVFLVMMLTGASAQETGSGGDRFLLAVLIEAFAPYIVALMGGIAAFLTPRVFALAGIVIDEKRAKALNDGFERGATLTLERMGDQLKGGIPFYRKEAAISSVVRYAKDSYPAAVKHFDKKPEELRKMAEIRLSGLFADATTEQRVSPPVNQPSA